MTTAREPSHGGDRSEGDLGPISVVVVNYNGAEHLPHCLAALAKSTVVPDELLVVDNASTDASADLVHAEFPGARVIRLPRNEGPCPARNLGLSSARNPWVLLVDNDAALLPDTLARMVAAAVRERDAVLLQPRSVFASEPSRVHYDGGQFHYAGLFSLRNFFVPVDQAEGQGTLAVDGAVSVVLLARRDVLLGIGGFDPAFFILFEDLDLSLRLRSGGHRILSVEDAIVHHRGGTPGISFRSGKEYPNRRAFLHARNRVLVLIKNYSWRTLFVAAPGLALYEFAWCGFALASGTFFAHLRGKWALVGALPRALGQRRAIQAARKVRDRDLLVGGPLTITPGLKSTGGRVRVLGALDRALRLWWRIARPFAG